MKLIYGFLALGITLGAVTVEARGPRGPRSGEFGNPYAPSCEILDQSGRLGDGCPSGTWRCYAEVRFANGYERNIKGTCSPRLAECWRGRSFAVYPGCEE